MTRSLTRSITILLALGSAFAALALFPPGCSDAPDETGSTTTTQTSTQTAPSNEGVGYPCLPPDELNPAFSGFKVNEEAIVADDFASCPTGICLVNHFQGRVTCPLGQPDAGSGCQQQGVFEPDNAGKGCCIPGTTTPVDVPVCGQCSAQSHRSADDTVYCSCRCALAEGAPPEPNAVLCPCPTGFVCAEIRKYTGLGDASLTGSYCIREGTEYTGTSTCGSVEGFADPTLCKGVGVSP